MNKTRIEWADYTWNPVTGCLGPKGDGVRCPYCYAHRLAKGRLFDYYQSNEMVLAGDSWDPFAPRAWPHRILEPTRVRRPSRIFVCDMADLFGDWMMEESKIIWRILRVAEQRCPQHTFMFLTKWPQNLAQFNPWPANCWVGATATNHEEARDAMFHLQHVEAPVLYLSCEPLLDWINLFNVHAPDWLIVGAQTGPGAKAPEFEWVRDISSFAKAYGVPLFLKDNLKWCEPCQEWPEGAKL